MVRDNITFWLLLLAVISLIVLGLLLPGHCCHQVTGAPIILQ